MMNLKSFSSPQLIEKIQGDDPLDIAAAAQECARRQEHSVAPYLLKLLQCTDDVQLRNSLALVLGDMQIPAAQQVLVDLLDDARTRGSRGTLLYALRRYDNSALLPKLVDLVIEGNYEVSREAFCLVQGIETELAPSAWQRCRERVRAAIETSRDEQRELLAALLALFDTND